MKHQKTPNRRADKIGRNQPCPCGSEKKFKHCCLNKRTPNFAHRRWTVRPIEEVPESLKQELREHNTKERERIARYGEIRPEISGRFKGQQFVAVGSKVFHSPKWKFFPDFLADYVSMTFGKEWFESEVAKPSVERHPVMQWRIDGIRYMQSLPTLPDGSRGGFPNGAFAAYMMFGYDLYTVDHNGGLDPILLTRLKHMEHFQGARHELFAEATCLRAGCAIEREDERDRSRRHAEFTATHKLTGQKLSVEAKSRHRPGVLGRPGTPQPHDRISLRFGELLNEVAKKNTPHPLVIFVDTNLPPRAADRLLASDPMRPHEPTRLMNALLERVRKEHDGRDPYNLVVFTNHAHHYAEKNEPDPRHHLVAFMPPMASSLKMIENPSSLMAITNAAHLYGNVPMQFPKMPGQTE